MTENKQEITSAFQGVSFSLPYEKFYNLCFPFFTVKLQFLEH